MHPAIKISVTAALASQICPNEPYYSQGWKGFIHTAVLVKTSGMNMSLKSPNFSRSTANTSDDAKERSAVYNPCRIITGVISNEYI